MVSGSRPARVCHVLFEHSPFDARVFHKEAMAMARAGYEVILLLPTLDGRTLGRARAVRLGSDGRFTRGGVEFRRYRHRMILPKELGIRDRATIRSMVKAMVEIDADVYHFHEDSVTMPAGLALMDRLPDRKFVFDMHEHFLLRRRFQRRSRKRRIRQYVEWETKTLSRVDLVLGVVDHITDYARSIGATRGITVMNCQSESLMKVERQVEGLDGRFVVCHEGRALFDRGFRQIVEVARHIHDERILFLFVGNLQRRESEHLMRVITEQGIGDRFLVTGWLDYDRVGDWVGRCHVGVNFLFNRNAISGFANKFNNYLRFGLPILTTPGIVTDPIIERYGCGQIVDPDDPRAIAELIHRLANEQAFYDQMAEGSRTAFREAYNWEVMEQRLLGAYAQMLAE